MSLELSVVIPVYNEGPTIGKTLRALRDNVRQPHEVLVVYDFDSDTTVPAVKVLQREFENVYLLKNVIRRGPSGAIRSGIEAARAPRTLVAMGDLCDDFTQIPQMMGLVPEHADIACPSRYCHGGRQLLSASFKKFAPQVAGSLLKFLINWDTHDPTNSCKLYSTEMLRKLRLTSTISFSVTLEIVAKAHCLGYRITEIPTTWRERVEGKSNFRLGRSLFAYTPWFLLALLRNRLFATPTRLVRPWLTSSGSAAFAEDAAESLHR